ncbi:MAG: sodium:solute symporter family protein [Moraxellaceae bacterium]|nr:sodium:solute symporter family protein [Moraxellaceae bacterium]
MLNVFVGLYVLLSIGIGLYAAKRVHNSTDYIVAGRRLPLHITTATVFATWFGSETVLGTSSTFIQEGLHGIVADPFGASVCLILVGVFFARHLYRKNLVTIGDFFKQKYGRGVELANSVAIMLSYLGWVSAQMIALGLVFNVLSHGAISQDMGIVMGAAIVISYTIYGGMWSVALTDFMQMIVIVLGMLYVGYVVTDEINGGTMAVIEHAAQANKFNFWPEPTLAGILAFVGAFVTLALGSIPQQDVFQRVMSAKDENTAVHGAVLGGSLYFIFAFVPIFLAYSAFLIDEQMTTSLLAKDSQLVLPTLVLHHTPLLAQVMFFGALLAAIMSTASGTLLAPSTIFTENILRPFLGKVSDTRFLWIIRVVVLIFGCFVTLFAVNSNSSIFEMVENAYKVTLVVAFVPLAAGVYWSKASTQGAVFSMVFGLVVWVFLEAIAPEGLWPPQLAGLLAAIVGMVVGALLPQMIASPEQVIYKHKPK